MFITQFFKNTYDYFKYKAILKEIYKNENLLDNMRDALDLDFKTDWVGRLYTVFNPFIKKGQYDPDSIIYDYQDGKISLDSYVDKVIMEKMIAVESQVIAKNMFDLVKYSLTPIDKFGNYLLIIEPLPYQDFIDSSKKMLKFLISLIVIGLIAAITIKTFIW